MIGDMKFLDSLREYDKDNIPPATIKIIRDRYMTNADFVPEVIQKVSSACEGLCKWVRAMEVYERIAKVVAPKKKSLEAAECQLAEQMTKLQAKQAELKTYQDKLATFEADAIVAGSTAIDFTEELLRVERLEVVGALTQPDEPHGQAELFTNGDERAAARSRGRSAHRPCGVRAARRAPRRSPAP